MAKRIVLDNYVYARYDYGEDINFKIYQEDKKTAFDATGLTPIVKFFKEHGDRAFFFRDVARALTVHGQIAQIIPDITGTWTTQASGIGKFAFTKDIRPTVPGYYAMIIQCVDNVDPALRTKQISSELLRVYVNPSEAA